MKNLPYIVSYIGIAIIMLGIVMISRTAVSNIVSSTQSFKEPLVHEWTGVPLILGWLISIPGVIFALIGGLVSRPRYFWIISVVIGSVYCISLITALITPSLKMRSYDDLTNMNYLIPTFLFLLPPGLLCIVEGIILRWLGKKQRTV